MLSLVNGLNDLPLHKIQTLYWGSISHGIKSHTLVTAAELFSRLIAKKNITKDSPELTEDEDILKAGLEVLGRVAEYLESPDKLLREKELQPLISHFMRVCFYVSMHQPKENFLIHHIQLLEKIISVKPDWLDVKDIEGQLSILKQVKDTNPSQPFNSIVSSTITTQPAEKAKQHQDGANKKKISDRKQCEKIHDNILSAYIHVDSLGSNTLSITDPNKSNKLLLKLPAKKPFNEEFFLKGINILEEYPVKNSGVKFRLLIAIIVCLAKATFPQLKFDAYLNGVSLNFSDLILIELNKNKNISKKRLNPLVDCLMETIDEGLNIGEQAPHVWQKDDFYRLKLCYAFICLVEILQKYPYDKMSLAKLSYALFKVLPRILDLFTKLNNLPMVKHLQQYRQLLTKTLFDESCRLYTSQFKVVDLPFAMTKATFHVPRNPEHYETFPTFESKEAVRFFRPSACSSEASLKEKSLKHLARQHKHEAEFRLLFNEGKALTPEAIPLLLKVCYEFLRHNFYHYALAAAALDTSIELIDAFRANEQDGKRVFTLASNLAK